MLVVLVATAAVEVVVLLALILTIISRRLVDDIYQFDRLLLFYKYTKVP